jgi:hypothetical protein
MLPMQANLREFVTINGHDIARLSGCADFSATLLAMVRAEVCVITYAASV